MAKRLPLVLAIVLFAISPLCTADSPDILADHIHQTSGVHAGLIVHLTEDAGPLTAALHKGDNCTVHALCPDPQSVARARQFIRSKSLYGPVSVEHWPHACLPYADNTVNLLVADYPAEIPQAEIMRALAPRGIAMIKHSRKWQKLTKPQPPQTDEWTHYLHDASGNAVAHDQIVAPPRHMQWIAAPRHTRSHEHTPGINALVTAQGRIFYTEDHASIESLLDAPQWKLVARDAYNGIRLWEKPFTGWFPYLVNWGVTPASLQRKLVADRDRLYVTLGYHAPVSALDAATGKTIKVYPNTEGTEEIIQHSGVLLLAIREDADSRTAEFEKMDQLAAEDNSPLHKRDSAQATVDSFRSTLWKGNRTILALNAASGRTLWKKTAPDASRYRPMTLCAQADCAYYQNGNEVLCLDLATGKRKWSSPHSVLKLVCGDRAICISGKKITALSAQTGKPLWTKSSLLTSIRDVFVARNALWLGGFKPIANKRGPSWGPYFVTERSLADGKVLRHIEPYNPSHHHRCYANKATDRYILAGRRGTEFFDLETGQMLEHSWARGVCRYGIMPANGLLYAPPHACACYVGARTMGFSALAPARQSAPPQIKPESSPATSPLPEQTDHSTDNWPTYRHDPQRSGATSSSVGPDLAKAWQIAIPGRLTAPTVAAGLVFVASVDDHRICAVDAATGKLAWDFTAAARIDSPPTAHAGAVIFGCRDGSAYCLRASDGKQLWRFQPESLPQRIMAFGQLESVAPAHGSVLVTDGIVSFTAGRNTYLDHGINLYRLDAATGRLLTTERIYSPDPETGAQPPQSAPYAIPGARSDILASDGDFIYLRDMVLDENGKQQTHGNDHLFTLTDYLDDSWPHRSYWIFGRQCSIACGCSGRKKDLIYGRILVFDDSTVYGYGRSYVHWSNQFEDGPYRLFAKKRSDSSTKWYTPVKIQIRAMILAHNTIFAAGPHTENDNTATLLVIDAGTGKIVAEHPLPAPPVFDALAATPDRLYLTLQNHTIISMTAR